MTIQEALRQGTKLLEDAAISAPRLNAEVLLAHAAGRDRAWLYAHAGDELTELWWIHYGRYLHERLSGKPTQYITRRQEFYGREFVVDGNVLIPRPETEHLVEAALEKMRGAPGAVIDVGCGSGAIAVTLALEAQRAVIGADISRAALCVAARNRDRLGARVELIACDLLQAFADRSAALIVSNPPYVPTGDRALVQREVRDWEPEVAVFGGEDGLDVYRRLAIEGARVLAPDGWLIVEIAFNRAEHVRGLLDAGVWKSIEVRRDLAGWPRVLLAQRVA
jgi:release factor glutamine methyltransferase